MSNQTGLTIYNASLPDRVQYAKHLAVSELLPVAYQRCPQNVLVAMEYGAALSIPPIQAINDINVIKGKPCTSANLLASLVRRAGHKLRISGDDTYAEATIIRADDPNYPMTVRWDMERAAKAGLLGNQVWQKYPAAMLRARAISEVARMAANEVLFGVIFTEEELLSTSTPNSENIAVIEAEVVKDNKHLVNKIKAYSQQLKLSANDIKNIFTNVGVNIKAVKDVETLPVNVLEQVLTILEQQINTVMTPIDNEVEE